MKQFCYQLLCTYAGNEERVRFTNPAGEVGTYCAYVYSYSGSLGWHVPKDFVLPVHCNLEVGWKLWLIKSKKVVRVRLHQFDHVGKIQYEISLSPKPWNLYETWKESEHGIGAHKQAKISVGKKETK